MAKTSGGVRSFCAGRCFGRAGRVGPERRDIGSFTCGKAQAEAGRTAEHREAEACGGQKSACRKSEVRAQEEYGAGRYSYIPKKNRRLAAALAQKDYDEKILKCATRELKLINKLLKSCEPNEIDTAYVNSPEGRRALIEPVRPSDEEFRAKWNEQESCCGNFGENDPEFYTLRGERVRSKSEVLIANILFKHGVDYLFECQMYLPGYGNALPDFFVLDLKNRRTIIWEHFGKMDEPSYVERNLRKLSGYLKVGYVIGETLILTFETEKQPISTAVIEDLVKHYFL